MVRAMRTRLGWFLVIVTVLATVTTSVVLVLRAASSAGSQPISNQSANFGRVPSYSLVNQFSRPVTSTQFMGKVQVVSFLFPYCTSYCPLITRNLVLLERRLAMMELADKVQFVSFNLDPVGAGPAQMRAYLAQYGADPSDPQWQFLTGTPAQIYHAVRIGFHIYYAKTSLSAENAEIAREKAAGAYSPQPDEPNALASSARVSYDIVHNDYIEVVDPTGKIVALFDSGSTVTQSQLMRAIDAALTRSARPRN